MDAEIRELPGSLRPTSASPFVGRESELEKLQTLMPRTEGERRRVALLSGEPGVGKSRLAREFAGQAAAEGVLVLYGACDAVVRTPYGPFVEALDRLARVIEAEELRAALGAGGGELTRLLPDLPALVGELPTPVEADPDTERHRLHAAVADLLANVSRGRPMLLVLEDGHWADAPTLLLLRHLARSGWSARLLILATFRDTETELPGGLSETLADLRRSDDVVRMRLPGLSGAEVSDLVSRAAGSDPDPELRELASTIHDFTGGNAFLVCELWRAVVETGVVEVVGGQARVTRPLTELGTPESVREVVSQRLSRLAPRTTDLLELAAVAGPEFELEPIRRAAGLAEAEFLVAVEEAVGSGMIEELPSQRLACRFTHEIVRRALYDRLSRLRRAELHLRVGEALESAAPATDRALADLAHHFGAAAPFGGAERAIDYNLRAASAASAALAFDDAAMRLRTAIEIGIEDEAERAEALLELGSANHRAGKAADGLEAFASVAEIARELGSAELLARAAIGYEEACWRPGIASRDAVELLEEALAEVDEASGELRISLLAGLARALDFRGERERGAIVRENAVALARRCEDRAALAKVLVRSYWARGTTPLEEILSMLTEARDLAEELGDAETHTEAMALRVPTFVALGDLESARLEVAAQREMAERAAQPFMQHVAEHYGSAIALCDGDLEGAEVMAARSHEWGQLLTGRDASSIYGIQMFGVRREQGRLAELAPAVRILAGGVEREGPWRPGLVAVLAELGMEAEARRELSKLASEGIEGFQASLWLATLAYLSDACAALGDEEMAAILYPKLEPLTGANVMIGHLVACYGSADRYLGMLAATLGERERAEEHFERAMEENERMGASTWVAHTAYEYGRFLLGRGRGSRERADALLGEAATLAERIGMEGLLGKIRSLGVPAPGAGLPGGLSPREAQILELVARGLSNREIGEELSISEHTAANHIRSILRKTDCANRTEAASYAHRHGLASA
jgi:DNA-binding CsgD family transcriptional regulator/tetratricopeptide (TPR) repeat protein/Mrp family chromosome partitioning ATPase